MKIQNQFTINIIGDSIAAGQGCSTFCHTNEVILELDDKIWYRSKSQNSWSALLEQDLRSVYPDLNLINNGCCGADSTQILKGLEQLYHQENLILLLVGANNRKIQNGMEQLRLDLVSIIHHLKKHGSQVVLMTPPPSTLKNENYPNRLYPLDEVTKIICDTALQFNLLCVDHYAQIRKYSEQHSLTIEELMEEAGCLSDGLHPTNKIQTLMADYTKKRIFF